MTDDVLETLNAERRTQWDERKEPHAKCMAIASKIIDQHTVLEVKQALMKHCEEARYPRYLRESLTYNIAGAYREYVICHVAAILEPERKGELLV